MANSGEGAGAAGGGGNGEREMEMGRLQQMLEARGLPSHILGALGPRFGGLLSRGPGPGPKVQGLIASMAKDGDESAQLTAVIELCNLLVMGNEETLGSAFPVKDVVKALLKLMQLEHNFEIMMQAVRGITYVMEALPRSTPIVVEAIPQLIQRCMDVAEQALAALDTLSKRHAKSVLMAGGVKAVLEYLDFFSLVPQRTALNIAANCATQVGKEELGLVLGSIPLLSEKLRQSDKKCVESVCAFFTRLVDNLGPTSPASLLQLTQHSLLPNVQNLLVVSPAAVSTGTFMSLLRMLHIMCTYNSSIAIELHRNHMGETLVALLVNGEGKGDMELVQRSAQELNELVVLIGELMPRLPIDGPVFSVAGLLSRQSAAPEAVVWSWKDDQSHWRPYSAIDSRILEAAYGARETEVSLQVGGNTYTVDLENMMQINDDTGNSRPLHRRVTPLQAGQSASRPASKDKEDARLSLDKETLATFVRTLFPVLYEVYATTAGPGIRQDCLVAMLRMIYHSSPDLLREVLKNLSISSHIANMLSSTDLKIVVGALQLVRILLEKVPDVFITYFRREGVLHQVERLMKAPPPSPAPLGLGAKSTSEPVLPNALPLPPSATGPGFTHPFLVGLPTTAASGVGATTAAPPLPIYGLLPPTNAASPTLTAAPPLPAYPSTPTTTSGFAGLMDGLGTSQFGLGLPNHPLGPCRYNSIPGSVDLGGQNAAWNAAQQQQTTSSVPLIPPPNFGEVLQVPTVPALGLPPPPPLDAEMHQPDTKGPDEESEATTEDGEGSGGSGGRRREPRHGKRRAAPLPGDLTLRTQHKLRMERNNNDGKSASRRKASASESGTAASPRKTSASSVAMSTRSRAKAPVPSTSKGASSSRRSGSTDPMAAPAKPSQAKKSGSFLADKLSALPLPRWARPASSQAPAPSQASFRDETNARLSATMLAFHHPAATSLPHHHSAYATTHLVNTLQSSLNKDKIKTWIRDQAKEVINGYFVSGEEMDNVVLGRLSKFAEELSFGDVDLGTKPLESLEATVVDSDVSSFEILHSGLIPALHSFLTTPDHSPLTQADQIYPVSRSKRIKRFLHVFLGIKEEKGKGGRRLVCNEMSEKGPALARLVMKLNACVNQVEQFPVKIHDLPGSTGTGAASLRGTSALRFFHTHQIKCILRRHPVSRELREWHRGPIKVDPLAQMSAIERYMIMKGYGRVRNPADTSQTTPEGEPQGSSSDDGASEDEFEETLAMSAGMGTQNRIQFLINDRVLPYEMTLYQAVRQYGAAPGTDTDTENEMSSLTYASIWVNTHTLWYRLAPDASKNTTDPKAKSGALEPASPNTNRESKKKATSKDKKVARSPDILWSDGVIPGRLNPLAEYLDKKLALCDDKATNEVLQLLRVLYGINKFWWAVFKTEEQTMKSFQPIISNMEFVNGKLSGKVTRQLQDPLTVLSQQVPSWIRSLAYSCPFVLSFESRQCVFYTCAFDRDRALQRLMEALPELGTTEGAEGQHRIAPRLERRKVSIQREDLLKQAEAVINSMDGNNRAVLEVQYQNEEGTGLGPTLEFYALVSKELQKSRLGLWRDGWSQTRKEDEEALVLSPHGLYPSSLSRVVKQANIAKVKAKFQFIGRLLARALTDSRMLDLPLSPVLYKWLLGEERTLSLGDLWELDPSLLNSLQSLLTSEGGREEIEALDLDFTLPGSVPAAELRKGGKDMPVSAENIVDYVKLVGHWMVYEGVSRQMEALVEGFDSVLGVRHLRMFYAEEMESLFCGSAGAWEAGALAAHLRPDHGYSHESEPVQWLVQIMSEYGEEEQRRFLHFITGSPKLPVGGFKALSPPLTVVRKGCAEGEPGGDAYLPSVMTCVNYLKLPHYSSKEVMAARLATAIQWGQNSFHLS